MADRLVVIGYNPEYSIFRYLPRDFVASNVKETIFTFQPYTPEYQAIADNTSSFAVSKQQYDICYHPGHKGNTPSLDRRNVCARFLPRSVQFGIIERFIKVYGIKTKLIVPKYCNLLITEESESLNQQLHLAFLETLNSIASAGVALLPATIGVDPLMVKRVHKEELDNIAQLYTSYNVTHFIEDIAKTKPAFAQGIIVCDIPFVPNKHDVLAITYVRPEPNKLSIHGFITFGNQVISVCPFDDLIEKIHQLFPVYHDDGFPYVLNEIMNMQPHGTIYFLVNDSNIYFSGFTPNMFDDLTLTNIPRKDIEKFALTAFMPHVIGDRYPVSKDPESDIEESTKNPKKSK